MAKALAAHPDFRVVRRLDVSQPGEALSGPTVRRSFGETGFTRLKVLLESARAPSFQLWALNSPFESKDVLKKRGYWWDAPKRCWYGEFRSREDVDGELAWLKESVHAGKGMALELEEFDAKTR
jgi:DNA polymerase-3 subunit epsilon